MIVLLIWCFNEYAQCTCAYVMIVNMNVSMNEYVLYAWSQSSVELGEPPAVRTAASLFQEFCYNNKDRLMAGIICAGE